MTAVFLSGSRKLDRLNDAIRSRLENMTAQNFVLLVGDANGADKAFQTHLDKAGYRNVVVFCSGNACRNNVGNWPTRMVEVSSRVKGREFYTQKDKAMAREAEYGFVIWDGKSAGSINNIIELLEQQKHVVVYVSSKGAFHNVRNPSELAALLSYCPRDDYASIDRKTHVESRIQKLSGSVEQELPL